MAFPRSAQCLGWPGRVLALLCILARGLKWAFECLVTAMTTVEHRYICHLTKTRYRRLSGYYFYYCCYMAGVIIVNALTGGGHNHDMAVPGLLGHTDISTHTLI